MRAIHEVTSDIRREWPNVHYTARPYLDAMFYLCDKHSKYGLDSASDIVLRFIGNATSFRGERARELKAELKQIIK